MSNKNLSLLIIVGMVVIILVAVWYRNYDGDASTSSAGKPNPTGTTAGDTGPASIGPPASPVTVVGAKDEAPAVDGNVRLQLLVWSTEGVAPAPLQILHIDGAKQQVFARNAVKVEGELLGLRILPGSQSASILFQGADPKQTSHRWLAFNAPDAVKVFQGPVHRGRHYLVADQAGQEHLLLQHWLAADDTQGGMFSQGLQDQTTVDRADLTWLGHFVLAADERLHANYDPEQKALYHVRFGGGARHQEYWPLPLDDAMAARCEAAMKKDVSPVLLADDAKRAVLGFSFSGVSNLDAVFRQVHVYDRGTAQWRSLVPPAAVGSDHRASVVGEAIVYTPSQGQGQHVVLEFAKAQARIMQLQAQDEIIGFLSVGRVLVRRDGELRLMSVLDGGASQGVVIVKDPILSNAQQAEEVLSYLALPAGDDVF